MSEVVYLIRHVLDKPVHQRTPAMKNVLATVSDASSGRDRMSTAELEKVAKAIYENDVRTQQPPISNYPWEKQNETSREVYRDMARAALEAIREPSKGMNKATASLYFEMDEPDWMKNALTKSYTTMIDHILGKEPTP